MNTLSSLPTSMSMSSSSGTISDSVNNPNSTEIFRQNLQVAHSQVNRTHMLAKACLASVERAYQPETSPIQTQADFRELTSLLHALHDFFHQSGLGALPLLPMPGDTHHEPPTFPSEPELTQAVGAAFDRLKRSQESAAVVSSLLNPS
ncbi:hypothetical protein CONPUDRAFT_160826 [Coniophora puteana RWD-64-598 SS2]|uniref:Uncharacterized protein n=1 Tax=Coniophora puteana (strain RWD-64-598) TaxID=741705 RepID=A0A5M3N4R3_CONPW|nr:uncharacterized protein CONPUDRAFT_160826 [Coniophora puteana RWD-64-598 SS2]EIW85901.1 hypothetical protein CONPUDRAFT_160826 [Coniophora puteana RWD-64-598 SS2]